MPSDKPRYKAMPQPMLATQRKNGSSMPAQGGGKGDGRANAKVETHDESGTATEHAKQPQRGTATEHAEQRRGVALKCNVQTQQHMEEAQADRADDTIQDMECTLPECLTYLLQELLIRSRISYVSKSTARKSSSRKLPNGQRGIKGMFTRPMSYCYTKKGGMS